MLPWRGAHRMTLRLRDARLAALAVVALLVTACGSTNPNSTPSPSVVTTPSSSAASASTGPATAGASATANPSDQGAVYEAINEQVQAIRGLAQLSPVTPTLVSSAQLADVVRQQARADTPPAQIAASEALYKAMGLLSPDASLSDLLDRLLTSEVAGMYVPATKKLYVLSTAGQPGPVERFFYSHEYDHALQDQHYDLQSFTKGFEENSDGGLARQALFEGDAYVTMTLWMQQYMSAGDMMAVLAAGLDPKATEVLATIPRIVQAQLLFAATQGMQFVFGLETNGGWAAVDRAWARPPESTEQILHPDKYAAYEPPVKVTLPGDLASRMGTGWAVRTTDTLGEYQLRIWLEDAGRVDDATATTAAAGWGGDRIELLDGPSGAWALAFRSAWDTASDASEFETAAQSIAGGLRAAGHGAEVLPGQDGLTCWIVAGSDTSSLSGLASALGLAG